MILLLNTTLLQNEVNLLPDTLVTIASYILPLFAIIVLIRCMRSMLGNKTPRQAAKSAAGRQKVAEWLKYLENQSANQPDPADPMATYSFEWMRKELGVHDLRR